MFIIKQAFLLGLFTFSVCTLAKRTDVQSLHFLYQSSAKKLDDSNRQFSRQKKSDCGGSYQVAGAAGVTIWATGPNGYQDRFLSDPAYLDMNLDYLIRVLKYEAATGGGKTVKK